MGKEQFAKPGRLSEGLGSFRVPETKSNSGPETKADIFARINQERDMSKIRTIPALPKVNPFDVTSRKRVVVYCRVSTDSLAQAPSFATQQRYYLNYVRRRPEWKMVAMYADEGISATGIEKRKGLVQMLVDAKEGKFDIIVVKNLSRLSRNLMDCMRIIYMLRSLPKPVGILFETENMFTLDRNVDFTLQILSLLAQEESHKRSEAVTAAQRQRYEQGNFIIQDLLGYDKIGVNKITINEEEAETVRLIFMMYMVGFSQDTIAEVLVMLGRKKHTHIYVDGRVKEGLADWDGNSVLNVLKNERCCGDVRAQKTVTPNYLDHKAVKNINQAPQYYAVDQHQAIVDPQDFYITQKMMAANRGGWKHGIQELGLYEDGILSGSVSSVPNWLGFTAEDYYRASLRAYGMDESTLNEIDARIRDINQEQQEEVSAAEELPAMVEINSDDYELFPDREEADDDSHIEEQASESFGMWVRALREKNSMKVDKESFGQNDYSNFEIARAELFSTREKVCFTIDRSGISFNKCAFNRMNEIMQVELAFNPVEQMIIIRRAEEATPKTLNWAKASNDVYTMKRCGCKGVATAIFDDMGWNPDYKYRVIGRTVEYNGETMLVFFLDNAVSIVPAKPYAEQNVEKKEKKKAKKESTDSFLPYGIVLPKLEDFDFGDEEQSQNMARSQAIYYDTNTNKKESELTLADLGDEKYSPERIRYMLQRGLSPAEGWSYLRGMAIIGKNKFSIYPNEWADSFGNNIYENSDTRLKRFMEQHKGTIGKPMPYGWTVGLNLPTMQTVNESIEKMKQEMTG